MRAGAGEPAGLGGPCCGESHRATVRTRRGSQSERVSFFDDNSSILGEYPSWRVDAPAKWHIVYRRFS